MDAWRPPTWRGLLGDALPATTVLAESKGGKLVELLPIDSAVRKALKAKGITIGQQDLGLPEADETPADVEKQRAELLREQERRNVELEYRRRLLHAIHSKWKGPLKRDDLEQIAVKLFDEYGIGDALEEIYPNGGNSFAKASEADIQRAIAVYFLADDCESAHGKPGRLLEAAQRLKIDPKKIRTAVVQDLKPTSAPAADDGKKPAKKKATKK